MAHKCYVLVTGVTQDFESVMVYFMLPSHPRVYHHAHLSLGEVTPQITTPAKLQSSYSSLKKIQILFRLHAPKKCWQIQFVCLFVFTNVHCRKKQEVNSKNMWGVQVPDTDILLFVKWDTSSPFLAVKMRVWISTFVQIDCKLNLWHRDLLLWCTY